MHSNQEYLLLILAVQVSFSGLCHLDQSRLAHVRQVLHSVMTSSNMTYLALLRCCRDLDATVVLIKAAKHPKQTAEACTPR